MEQAYKEYYKRTAELRDADGIPAIGTRTGAERDDALMQQLEKQQQRPLLVPGRVLYLQLKPGTDKWAEATTPYNTSRTGSVGADGQEQPVVTAPSGHRCFQQQYVPTWLDGNAEVLNTMAVSHYMLADHLPTKVAKALSACARAARRVRPASTPAPVAVVAL